jgi:hypothetical protein
MRDVLSHPFFGIGKLAGVAPVFNRPKLGQATKIVDISTTSVSIIQSKEVNAGKESMATVNDEKKKPDEASAPVKEPSPSPPRPTTESSALRPEIVREVEPERKLPAVPQPQAPPPPAPVAPTPAPPPTSSVSKSKFGIKGLKFGKKK